MKLRWLVLVVVLLVSGCTGEHASIIDPDPGPEQKPEQSEDEYQSGGQLATSGRFTATFVAKGCTAVRQEFDDSGAVEQATRMGDRVRGHDDYLDLERRDAIEEYQREKGKELAACRERIQGSKRT